MALNLTDLHRLSTRALLAACLLTAVGCARPVGMPLASSVAPAGIAAAGFEALNEPGWTAPQEDLGHFFKVNDALFRGQQPTDKGLQELQGMGVKTVVYLHYDKKQAAHEKAIVESLGMKFVHIPMSWILPPKKAQIEQWLAINADAANQPVFVHCQHGKDRTGTLVAMYRISHDHWDYKKASAEMKEKGFRTYLFGLSWSVKHFANQHGGHEMAEGGEVAYANTID